jgi:opacity protein-like surface antigen
MMKKLLFCLALVCCLQPAFAQELRWGMRFGATFSMLAGEDWELVKDEMEYLVETELPGLSVTHSDYWGLGFSAGLLFEISLFRFLAIQPEILYTTYHGGMKVQNDAWSSDWAKFGWIYRLAEVPLLLKLRLSKKVAVFGGPLLMYRFLPPKAIVITADDRDSEPIRDDSFYKELAYGVVGGVELRTSNETFVEVRYNYNLTSLDNYGYPFQDDTVFHGIVASVGFLF